ncbi:zf-HC2 domain-containing protein [Streptomyces sp. NPDC001508]|uniref:anti-sigma factor family protein n=1 Tax=Streptomyces sp. NPDC001508 TaxID=3154656 RepID=UPI0033345696
MSGSRSKPARGHLAEEHLGDRLSALVDGELGHDARERVLAHLATCARCKAEADAQRQLKNVFAESAPPPPSESFLARLQGLPASDGPDGGSPLEGGLPGGSTPGVFEVGREDRFEFGYVPARPHSPSPLADRGFRIHPVGRPDTADRHSRGMRFAFVAAGAVSLAAVALGGVTTGIPRDTAADARGGADSVTPTRTAGTGAATTSEAQRRRPVGPLLMQGTLLGETPVASASVSAPLRPGAQAPATGQAPAPMLTTPVEAGAATVSPLIRPFGATPPISLISWSSAPGLAPPGVLAAPVPDSTPAPSPSPPSSSSSSSSWSPSSAASSARPAH